MTNQNPITYAQESKFFVINGRLKQVFFGLLALTGFSLVLFLVDFVYQFIINQTFRQDFWQLLHIYRSRLETNNRMMANGFTATLRFPTCINGLLIILIFVLNRARPKATYHNFSIMTTLFACIILLNMFIFTFYRTPVLANALWYTVFAFPFIALPIHEYQKLKKTPNLLPNSSFIKSLLN